MTTDDRAEFSNEYTLYPFLCIIMTMIIWVVSLVLHMITKPKLMYPSFQHNSNVADGYELQDREDPQKPLIGPETSSSIPMLSVDIPLSFRIVSFVSGHFDIAHSQHAQSTYWSQHPRLRFLYVWTYRSPPLASFMALIVLTIVQSTDFLLTTNQGLAIFIFVITLSVAYLFVQTGSYLKVGDIRDLFHAPFPTLQAHWFTRVKWLWHAGAIVVTLQSVCQVVFTYGVVYVVAIGWLAFPILIFQIGATAGVFIFGAVAYYFNAHVGLVAHHMLEAVYSKVSDVVPISSWERVSFGGLRPKRSASRSSHDFSVVLYEYIKLDETIKRSSQNLSLLIGPFFVLLSLTLIPVLSVALAPSDPRYEISIVGPLLASVVFYYFICVSCLWIGAQCTNTMRRLHRFLSMLLITDALPLSRAEKWEILVKRNEIVTPSGEHKTRRRWFDYASTVSRVRESGLDVLTSTTKREPRVPPATAEAAVTPANLYKAEPLNSIPREMRLLSLEDTALALRLSEYLSVEPPAFRIMDTPITEALLARSSYVFFAFILLITQSILGYGFGNFHGGGGGGGGGGGSGK